MSKFLIIVFAITSLLVDWNVSSAQHVIKGKLIDSKTNEALAFATIIANSNSLIGSTSDIDGRFLLKSKENVKTVTCSYIGYKNLILSTDSIDFKLPLTIKLEPLTVQLREFTVKAGENPANRIIRKVVENKSINNPENIPEFSYTSYNKTTYDFNIKDTVNGDSLKNDLNRELKGGHLSLMESTTKRDYIAPNFSKEIVLGTKIAGFKNPTIATLTSDIQPFSFYNEIITVLDVNYINPISNGGLNKYNFYIEDTLFQNNDTVFILTFQPQSGKNYECLKGLLYINANRYALQNVIAEPAEKGLIDVKIQQLYEFIENKHWFPVQLNFELLFTNYPTKNIGMFVNGKSYISDIKFSSDLSKKDFSSDIVIMAKLASNRDSVFWNKYRVEKLEDKEITTYRTMDSIGKKNNFDALLRIGEKIGQNKIPIKFMDIDLTETLVYNQYEGLRLGLGAFTNERVMTFMSLGGFFGYGINDNQWKYGAQIQVPLNTKNEIKISAKYQNTYLETGQSGIVYFNKRNGLRKNLASQMDRIEQTNLSLEFRTLKYAKVNASLSNTISKPLYSYQFQPDINKNITSYTNSDLTLRIRYAYKEKRIESLNQKISIGSDYPIIYVSYTKGIADVFNSEFNYNKIEGRIEKSFLHKIGKSSIHLDGGFIDTPLPYGLLFTGEGSFDKDLLLSVKNYFQTATNYEFLSDKYVTVFLSHNFGFLFFKYKKLKPDISIHQNMGWGSLSHSEYHQLTTFKTKEKGFYESGILIDNILRIKFLNLMYLGFGTGLYYRYGHYALNNTKENVAIKFSLVLKTR